MPRPKRRANASAIISSMPVAIKSSNSVSKWTSLMIDEEDDGEAPYVRLRQERSTYTVKHAVNFLLRASEAWTLLFHLTIVASFAEVAYDVFVAPLYYAFYTGIAYDLVYGLDVAFNFALAASLKKLRVTDVVLLFLDVTLLFPFWAVDRSLARARLLVFLRLYKVAAYLFGRRRRLGTKKAWPETAFYAAVILHALTCLATNYGDAHPLCAYLSSLELVSDLALQRGLLAETRRGVALVVPIFGFVLLAYYTAGVFLLEATRERRRLYFAKRLRQLTGHCAKIGMGRKFVDDVRKYYRLEWENKMGVRKTDALDLLLPKNVRGDALFDVGLPALKSSMLFRNCGESYLRHVASLMRHEFYADGELVYKRGEVKNKMVVVVSGVVDVNAEENDGSPILSFGPGTCLGESSLIYTLRSKSSVKARTYVEVQALHRKDLCSTITFYPEQHAKMSKAVNSRILEANNKSARSANPVAKIADNAKPEPFSTLSLYKVAPLKRPWCLNKWGYPCRAWNVFVATLALGVCISYPYFVAFERRFPAWFVGPAFVAEVIFWADLFVGLVTGDGLGLKATIVENLDGWRFCVDFLAAFHFEGFAYAIADVERWYYLLKLNRLLKFYKFLDASCWLEGRFVYLRTIRVLKASIMVCMATFWLTMAAYATACFGDVCVDYGWFKVKMWSESDGSTERPAFASRRLFAAFYALSYVNSFEVHEVRLVRTVDKVVAAVLMLLGTYGLANFVAYVGSATYLTLKSVFRRNLELVETFCKDVQMPDRLRARLLDYYRLRWEYGGRFEAKEGRAVHIGGRDAEEAALVREHVDCLRNVGVLFRSDPEFLKAVSLRAKTYVLPPDDFVTYYGGTNKEMFVIEEGFCVYKTEGGMYKKTGPNSVFGMSSLFFNLPEVVTVRTITHCRLISIDGHALQDTLHVYPHVNEAIRQVYNEMAHRSLFGKPVSMPVLNHSERRGCGGRWREFSESGSIINVLRYCDERKEMYMESFYVRQMWRPFKYLLLPYTLLPDGIFVHLWTAFRLLVALTYGLLAPVQQIASPHLAPLHNTLFGLNFVGYLDAYLMLHVCYYDPVHGQLVMHPCKTAVNYLSRSFALDLLVLFPYELVLPALLGHGDEGHSPRSHAVNAHYLHCSFRLVRTLQVYKVFVAIRSWEKSIKKNGFVLRSLKHLLVLVLFVDWFACLLLYNTCKYVHVDDIQTSPLQDYVLPHGNVSGMYCRRQSWLNRSKYGNLTDFGDVYLTACYWITNIIVGQNFNDLEVQGGAELVVAVLALVFGILFFLIIMIDLLPYCIKSDRHIVVYRKQLDDLVTFMRREKINKKLMDRTYNAAVYHWKRTRDLNTTSLLSCLHTTLLQDCLSFLYEETLKEVPLFRSTDQSFLRILAMIVKPQHFLQGQTIVEADQIIDEFYIVHRGSVLLELTRSTVRMQMGRGSLFGYYYNESLPVMTITVEAASNVDVLCVRTADYYNILKNYSIFKTKVKEVMSEYKDFMPCKTFNGHTVSLTSSTKRRRLRSCSIPGMCLSFLMEHLLLLEFVDLFYAVASYVNAVVVILQVTFQSKAFFALDVVLDSLFLLKVILNFYRPYYNNYGELVTDRKLIKQRYMKNQFSAIVDFLVNTSACATYVAFHPSFVGGSSSFFYFTLLRFVTLQRCVSFVRYVRRHRGELLTNQVVLELMCLVFWLTLVVLCVTCTWVLIRCPFESCSQNFDPQQSYLASITFVSNVLTKTGAVEIELRTNLEKMFVMFTSFFSRFLFVIIVGTIANLLMMYSEVTLKYDRRLKEVKDYLNCANVSSYQVGNVVRYLKNLWTWDNGSALPELLKKLPKPITNELKIALYKPLLSKSYLFTGTEDLFLRNVSVLLEHAVYYPGNVIVYHDQIDECMYFIRTGEVEILSFNSNHTETVHDVLQATEMFGLGQGLFHCVPHQFTFRAKTRCQILALRLDQWKHLLRFYEKSKEIIYRRIRNIHLQLNK